MGVEVEKLQEKFLEKDEVKWCLEVLTSGLLEAVAFPPAFLSPKLLQFYIDHYDVKTKRIINKNGELMLFISKETISFISKFLECAFSGFSLPNP